MAAVPEFFRWLGAGAELLLDLMKDLDRQSARLGLLRSLDGLVRPSELDQGLHPQIVSCDTHVACHGTATLYSYGGQWMTL